MRKEIKKERIYCNLEDYLNSKEVQEKIERNELELRRLEQAKHEYYNSIGIKDYTFHHKTNIIRQQSE